MGSVRAFIAVKIYKKTCESFAEIIQKFKDSHADVSWVHLENLHITLKFLGNIDSGNITPINKTLSKLAENFKAFELRIKGIGAIPNPSYPRVVIAGLAGENKTLNKLAAVIESALEPLGIKREERLFLPHLTLGRVKSFKSKTMLMNKIREYHDREIVRMLVDKFHFMKSELMPGRPVYSDISEMPLKIGEGK